MDGNNRQARGMDTDTVSSDSSAEPMLLSLPTELLELVLSYVDARCLSTVVIQVCRKLNDVVKDETFWRSRILRRWPKPYPALPDHFRWRTACMAREEAHRLWSDNEINRTVTTVNVSFASLDAINFVKDGAILAVGCRDHNIFAFETKALLEKKCPKQATLFTSDVHKGWVWHLSSYDAQLCSGSWDGHVMTWDVTSGRRMCDFKFSSAVLSTSFVSDYEVFAGIFNKRVYCMDLRTNQYTQLPRRHGKPVLCLASDGTHIISGSEDGTIAITDRRNTKASHIVKLRSYPTSLSYDGRLLYVGRQDGGVELFSRTAGVELQPVEEFSSSFTHSRSVTSVHHTAGVIFSSSKDHTCKVWEPSLQPGLITSIHGNAEISKMHFANGVLGLACGDGSLQLHHSP